MVYLALLFGHLSLAAITGGGQASLLPDPIQDGSYAASSLAVSITCPTTGDLLQTTIHYPALTARGVDPAGAPYATIVFAPAFFANPAYYSERGRHLASLGYIVAMPLFPDENLESRASDIQCIFTYLEAEDARPGSPFFRRIDTQRFGLAGHSLGGVGTMMVAARDQRIKVAVSLDPINPPPAFTKISRFLAAAHGNMLRALLSTKKNGSAAENFTGRFESSAGESWNYQAEAPNIHIPLAVIGAGNPCVAFTSFTNYSHMFPAVGSPHKALFVLSQGSHCDFLYTTSDIPATVCQMLCSLNPFATRSQERERRAERYLTAWFEYYLHNQAEYYPYVYGAEVEEDVTAGTIVTEAHTAPGALSALAGTGTITLTWTMPDYPVIAGYNIYRRQEGGIYSPSPFAQTGRVMTYEDGDVVAGQRCYYILRSRDAEGNEHQSSEEVSGVPGSADKELPQDAYLPLLFVPGLRH